MTSTNTIRRQLLQAVAGLGLFGLLISTGGCEVKVGNLKAEAIFSDASVAALARAAARGDVSEVNRLIESGVPVDGLGKENWTPLYWAMLANSPSGMEALLKHKANPNHRIQDPQSLGGGFPIVLMLARVDRAPLLELLLKYGANPNTRYPVRVDRKPLFPYEGDSLLIDAAIENQLDNVKVLVKYGADVNLRPQVGDVATEKAAGLGRFEIAEYLLEHGATMHLDTVAHALQNRAWDPRAHPQRIKLLEMLHARGAKIYFNPDNPDTPAHLLSPGTYKYQPYKGETPVQISQ
jgi:ankyrin repeat protein